MRRLFAAVFSCFLLASAPAMAVMEDYPSVKLQGLDKSVGRTVTFEAKVGSTIQYGTLFVKIQSCRKAPPIEKPESAAFLQIWEVPPGEEKSEWVFSGWMFASSPSLSAMDHPVYDIWVLDCIGREEPNEEAKAAETDKQADQTQLSPAPAETDQQPAPVDSEAEEQAPVSPAQEVPATQGEVMTPAAPEQTEDPAKDKTTAYDFMRQNEGVAPTPIAPSPTPTEPVQIEEEAPDY